MTTRRTRASALLTDPTRLAAVAVPGLLVVAVAVAMARPADSTEQASPSAVPTPSYAAPQVESTEPALPSPTPEVEETEAARTPEVAATPSPAPTRRAEAAPPTRKPSSPPSTPTPSPSPTQPSLIDILLGNG